SPLYDIGGNVPMKFIKRWQKSDDITNVQKFSQVASNLTPYNLARASDLNIVDASFIRFKNISLSYNFQGQLLDKLNLNQLGISIQAQNLWTWTSYFGLDPQSPGSLTTLPALRMVTASIQLQF